MTDNVDAVLLVLGHPVQTTHLSLDLAQTARVIIARLFALGVFIKNAEVLERLEKVDNLVVDKTRTPTEGHPQEPHQ